MVSYTCTVTGSCPVIRHERPSDYAELRGSFCSWSHAPTRHNMTLGINRELCGPQWGAALLAKRFSSVTNMRRGDGVSRPEASKEDAAMTWRLEPAGVKERGTHRQRHTRTWETQAGVWQPDKRASAKARACEAGMGVRLLHNTRRRESRSHGEGSSRVAHPAQET